MAVEATVSPGLERRPPLRLGAAKATPRLFDSCLFSRQGHYIDPVFSSTRPSASLPTAPERTGVRSSFSTGNNDLCRSPSAHFSFCLHIVGFTSTLLSTLDGTRDWNHEMIQTTRPNQDQTVLRWMASCDALIQLRGSYDFLASRASAALNSCPLVRGSTQASPPGGGIRVRRATLALGCAPIVSTHLLSPSRILIRGA
ncbi:hypothetical protein BDP81DRAFT_419231 [Colletotrichum phormii]|uniref:Uncharacterized protein n=1 Tax=Colletotrichum phormii TaxID=359342 RepID=A0AAJ0EKI0_9PEZI|nr:uncharacterized protein BDP81DRAFT_419231 [Colletotrichum phormii]KAK1640031.1 hypothetical protein BDP81DRAFT_419231 [Colletotrichum phormii]